MEEIGCFVPVDPHASEIVTEQVVEWVPREEAEAVWNPVSLASRVVVVGLCTLAQFTDGICTFLVCT